MVVVTRDVVGGVVSGVARDVVRDVTKDVAKDGRLRYFRALRREIESLFENIRVIFEERKRIYFGSPVRFFFHAIFITVFRQSKYLPRQLAGSEEKVLVCFSGKRKKQSCFA